MKTITTVTKTNTYQLFSQLLEAGFNVELHSAFDYSYSRDNQFLSITVREADERLTELYRLIHKSGSFNVVLSMYANEPNACFCIAKHPEYAEFVLESVWLEYYNTL